MALYARDFIFIVIVIVVAVVAGAWAESSLVMEGGQAGKGSRNIGIAWKGATGR